MHYRYSNWGCSFCIPSERAQGTDECTWHAHQELTRMWLWAYESGTGACTEHMHQELMRAQSTAPSKYAEHTHQELIHTLCIRVRNWCVPWAHRLGADAYPEHTHQFLSHMLSISVKIPNLKSSLQNMLSMYVKNWCTHWACAIETDACTERRHQETDAHAQHADQKFKLCLASPKI